MKRNWLQLGSVWLSFTLCMRTGQSTRSNSCEWRVEYMSHSLLLNLTPFAGNMYTAKAQNEGDKLNKGDIYTYSVCSNEVSCSDSTLFEQYDMMVADSGTCVAQWSNSVSPEYDSGSDAFVFEYFWQVVDEYWYTTDIIWKCHETASEIPHMTATFSGSEQAGTMYITSTITMTTSTICSPTPTGKPTSTPVNNFTTTSATTTTATSTNRSHNTWVFKLILMLWGKMTSNMLLLVAFFAVILAGILVIVSKCCVYCASNWKQGKHFLIFKFVFDAIDVYSDIRYIMMLIDLNELIFATIVAFGILLSMLINLLFIFKIIQTEINAIDHHEYNNNKNENDDNDTVTFAQWFPNYSWTTSFVCIISVIDITLLQFLVSNIFNMQAFDSPLRDLSIIRINMYHIIGIIFENIPQLCIAVYIYIYLNDDNTITLMTFFISVIDILAAAITTVILYCIVRTKSDEEFPNRHQRSVLNPVKHVQKYETASAES